MPFAINSLINILNFPPVIIDIEKDKYSIWEQYRTFERKNSVAMKYPHLLEEWCYEKNSNLDPYCFSYGTNDSVWWKCKNNPNHIWKASISSRKNTGCPFCVGAKFFPGENDLATMRPDLVDEWNYEANGDLTPYNVAFGSNKKVFWICKDCKYQWPAVISIRSVAGCGCPECAKKKRQETRLKTLVQKQGSFADNHPDLLLDWDYENNTIDPKAIPSRIGKKVWWKCHTCAYIWKDSPDARVGKSAGCPRCNRKERSRVQRLRAVKEQGCFVNSYPHLLLDWDYENNEVSPEELVEGSHFVVKWKCHLCEHTWTSRLYKRTVLEHRCPKCRGKSKQ